VLATLAKALVEVIMELQLSLILRFQMIVLGSFTSDTYFTSVKTEASTAVAIIAAAIVIFDSTSSAKHFVILHGFTYRVHVADLVSGTLKTL
jgi:hypothetical protein